MKAESPEQPEPEPPSPSTNLQALLLEGMSSSNNSSTSLITPASGRKSCTSFSALFAEHRRIASSTRIDRDTITYHLSQTRRFLRTLELDESADPLFIAAEDAFGRETDRAISLLGYGPGDPDARNLRSAVRQVRATFLLRHDDNLNAAASPESFGNFWSAYLHYGTVAFKLGYLGTFPANSGSIAGLPREANATLLRNFGIPQGAVNSLKEGINCVVIGAMKEPFEALEKLLRAPPGALTRHITFRGSRIVNEDLKSQNSVRYSESRAFKYAIKIDDWPDHLRLEVQELIRQKQKISWTTRKDGYCGAADSILGLLQAFVGWLRLPLNDDNKWRSGAGKDLKAIPSVLAELVTPETLDRYAEFRLAHTVKESDYISGEGRPVFNTALSNLYHLAAHLLKPPHKFKRNRPAGFVFRNPDRYAKMLEHILPNSTYDAGANAFIQHHTEHDRWVAFCLKARSSFFETLEGAVNTARSGKSRSTEAGIESILALPNPRQAVYEMLADIGRDYEGYSWEITPHDKARLCRRQLFFELMAIIPHRIRLWAILARSNFSLREDSEGQRFYHLHIDKADFKNHRYLDVDYELSLPPRLTPLIDCHFSTAWPILNATVGIFSEWRNQNGGKAFLCDESGAIMPISKDPRYATLKQMMPSDRVFGSAYGETLPKKDRKTRKPLTAARKTAVISHNLQMLTLSTTGRFLGDRYKTNGFYPHAFRHITATAEIRLTGSFERAALLLWDSVEMVMKTYSHVKRSDLLAAVVQAQELEFQSLSRNARSA